MKTAFALLAVLFLFTSALALRAPRGSDQDTLQQLYNGFFEQAGLPDPVTVVNCYDDDSASLTVNFLGTALQFMADLDALSVHRAIKNFEKQAPQSLKDCINSNAEMETAQKAYNLPSWNLDQISTKIEYYALDHVNAFKSFAFQANNDFQSGDYNSVGKEGGAFIAQIFKQSTTRKVPRSDRDTLQLVFNGFWEQAGLADPQTAVGCFDDQSATDAVNALGNSLSQLTYNNVAGAEKTIINFATDLPQPVKDCLGANDEVQNMLSAYKIKGLTTAQVEQKVAEFLIAHILQLHKDAVQANNNFQSGNYKPVGTEGGVIAQQIFGKGKFKSLRSDRDTLQLVFNGFWEQAGLSDPQTAVTCFDDNSATQAVNALGNSLSQLANNNVAGAEKTVTDFVNGLPQSVKDCLGANSEVQSMLSAYHIAGLTPAQVQQKLVKFLVTHIFSLHKDAVQANTNFQSGNYKPIGTEGGVIAQQVFGNGAKKAPKDNKSTLQLLNNGFFEQAGLPDPVTILNCYDDDSATLTVDFIGTVLQQMADNNAIGVKKTIQAFQAKAPQALKDCLNSNAEIQTVQRAYGFYGMTLDQIQGKIQVYAFAHLIAFRKSAIKANDDFKAGSFVTVGKEGGQMATQIFQQSRPAIFAKGKFKSLKSDRDTLQLVFNGFWEQAGLSDPQTAVTCFDDNSATQAVNALGNSLSQLANNNVAGAEKTITDFVNGLPQSVKDCLGANSEVQSMLSAYHIAGLTPAQVQQKLAKFLVTHIFSLHKDAVQANSNFQSGNYKPIGTEGGVIAQEVFGSGIRKTKSLKDAESSLQEMYNGYFEQANLTDPTTILSCYDDDSAQLTVNFIGTVLIQMANNMVVAVEKTLKAYQAQMPEAVKQCLINNAEVQQVKEAYGYSNLTLILLQARIEIYAASHIAAFHEASTQANNDFRFGNFKTIGIEGGQLIQAVFGSKKKLRSDADTLQGIFTGLFNQVGLTVPTTVVACFDTNSQGLTNSALGTVLDSVSHADFVTAATAMRNYFNNLPSSVTDCLQQNGEYIQFLRKYHLATLTTTQFQAKIAEYVVLHRQQVVTLDNIANQYWINAKFPSAGQQVGVLLQNIFPMNTLVRDQDPKDTLQQYLNGYFEYAKLEDPTTIVSSCFNDDTATLVVNLVANLVDELANNKVLVAEKTALDFIKTCPPALKACVFSNPEVLEVVKAYGLSSYTPPTAVAKVVAYALTHAAQFTGTMVSADQAIQIGEYASAGTVFGQVTQMVFIKSAGMYFRGRY